jgi:hypothetical protein
MGMSAGVFSIATVLLILHSRYRSVGWFLGAALLGGSAAWTTYAMVYDKAITQAHAAHAGGMLFALAFFALKYKRIPSPEALKKALAKPVGHAHAAAPAETMKVEFVPKNTHQQQQSNTGASTLSPHPPKVAMDPSKIRPLVPGLQSTPPKPAGKPQRRR